MRRPRTEARAGDWMTHEGLTNRGPLQKPIFVTGTTVPVWSPARPGRSVRRAEALRHHSFAAQRAGLKTTAPLPVLCWVEGRRERCVRARPSQKLTTFAAGPLAAAWKSFMPPSLTRRSSEAVGNPRASTQGRHAHSVTLAWPAISS